jgi:glutaredoxin 3|tara:strand:+ start:307 stop:564 length:258 start_codon:yes stop_codon:yes gene_type:complete
MKIDIYTSPLCGFCTIAKNLLIQKGANFNEYDVLKDPSLKPIMIARTNGAKTVPQIFFNEQYIGGCEQLFGLDQNGKLDEILSKK